MHTCTNIKSNKNPFEMWWKCSWAHILCSVRKINGTVKYKLRNKRWKKTQLWKCDGDWQAIWDSGAMYTAHSTQYRMILRAFPLFLPNDLICKRFECTSPVCTIYLGFIMNFNHVFAATTINVTTTTLLYKCITRLVII